MKETQILNIAKKHIEKMNFENPYSEKMNWIETNHIIIPKGYFFEYEFELKNPKEDLIFGGAPGFTINVKTGELEDISWEEYNEFKIK